MCDTLASSAANQGDNTVSVAQGGTATPGATEQLLLPDRVFKRNIYLIYLFIFIYFISEIYIYIYMCVCMHIFSEPACKNMSILAMTWKLHLMMWLQFWRSPNCPYSLVQIWPRVVVIPDRIPSMSQIDLWKHSLDSIGILDAIYIYIYI